MSNAVATVAHQHGLVPTSMMEAMKLAEMMAGAKLVPQALQKSPADCLLVIQQAVRWQMDPFAVAQECSVIQGKLMHSGKLVAAVVNARGNLADRLSFSYIGENGNRTITVSGRLQGEKEPRTVAVRLSDAKTNNRVWQTQPDQQLMYHGVRVWARRHTPELMLGVYSPEEFDEAPVVQANDAIPIVIDHDDTSQPVRANGKRTRAEIQENAARKRHEMGERIPTELSQITSLSEMDRYERDVLTPEFMSSMGVGQYSVEEMVARRREELEAEAAVEEVTEAEESEAKNSDEPTPSQRMALEECQQYLAASSGLADLKHRAQNNGYVEALATLTEGQRKSLRNLYAEKQRFFKASPVEAG